MKIMRRLTGKIDHKLPIKLSCDSFTLHIHAAVGLIATDFYQWVGLQKRYNVH